MDFDIVLLVGSSGGGMVSVPLLLWLWTKALLGIMQGFLLFGLMPGGVLMREAGLC